MKLKMKYVKNDSLDYVLKLSQIFPMEGTISLKYMTDFMEFYENNKLVGLINIAISPVPQIEKFNLYIRNIYYIDKDYLDKMIKVFVVKIMKTKKLYNSIFANISHKKFNNDVIESLINNNFKGQDYVFLDC